MADNKIELTIAGLSIVVSTPEDASFTEALASEVDGDIRTIMRANEGASVTSAALLCAIDYLYNTKRAEKSSSNMRSQIKDYLAEAAASKLECEEERRRALDLTAEIQTLRTQLTRLAVDSDNTITDKMKSQLTATTNELTTMRSRVNELILQNKSLSDKTNAMSGLIAQREDDIVRANDENLMLKTQLAARDGTVARQAQTIDELSAENRAVKEEVERLNSELDTLEKMIIEEERRSKELRELADLAAQTGVSVLETAPETGYAPYDEPASPAAAETQVFAESVSEPAEAEPVTEPVVETDFDAPETETASAAPEALGDYDARAHFTLEEESAPCEPYAAESGELEERGEPDELVYHPQLNTARASLTDPVLDDGEPRPQLFDYEASLADESYEQLDVAMIAEPSHDELTREEETEDADEEVGVDFDDDDADEEDGNDDKDDNNSREPDYKLKTDGPPESFGVSFEGFASAAPIEELEEIIEPLGDDAFSATDMGVVDELVARGADDAVEFEPEERTVHVERRFDEDEPEKPDLSWTLNI